MISLVVLMHRHHQKNSPKSRVWGQRYSPVNSLGDAFGLMAFDTDDTITQIYNDRLTPNPIMTSVCREGHYAVFSVRGRMSPTREVKIDLFFDLEPYLRC